jgi:arylsulfatase A-like enzyme
MTPTIDRLCENGVRFSQAYSSCPICIPARRSLMTGTSPRTHGDRTFKEKMPMNPAVPTLPGTFREAGYQCYAVGKLHVYPQRSRIGFDEAWIHEEGRHHLGMLQDDYERYLAEQGYPGQEMTHGMGVNEYVARPWHLPEHVHPTYWTTKQMCRVIQRRDPTRPAFWYCSYAAPHPPLTPPAEYWRMYESLTIDEPVAGEWAEDYASLPTALQAHIKTKPGPGGQEAITMARKAFYAQCTYIDHQIRLLIGTLREENLLDQTILMFISDHGDMLGNHHLWMKNLMYDFSCKIPMILVPPVHMLPDWMNRQDDRLAELRDVMPTLLEMCGIDIPDSVEGLSLLSDRKRSELYGEFGESLTATRMMRDERFKLIYYPAGNRFQLFDLQDDPYELHDLSESDEHETIRQRLCDRLIGQLYGSDLEWIRDGALIGFPAGSYIPSRNAGLTAQRGWR